MLLNYQQLTDRLGIKKNTLYAMVCRKRIPHIRISGRMVRFDSDVIDKWINARTVEDIALCPEDSNGMGTGEAATPKSIETRSTAGSQGLDDQVEKSEKPKKKVKSKCNTKSKAAGKAARKR